MDGLLRAGIGARRFAALMTIAYGVVSLEGIEHHLDAGQARYHLAVVRQRAGHHTSLATLAQFLFHGQQSLARAGNEFVGHGQPTLWAVQVPLPYSPRVTWPLIVSPSAVPVYT